MASSLEPLKSWPAATKNYLEELQLEMKRVSWPTRKQVQATTAVVILTVFFFAAYFAIVDKVIDQTVTRLYSVLSK